MAPANRRVRPRPDGSPQVPGRAPQWRRKRPTPTTTDVVRREGQDVGQLQWSRVRRVTGRMVTRNVANQRLLNAARETVLYGFRNLKNFDDYGALSLYKEVQGNINYMPMAVYLLNGCNRMYGGQTNYCVPGKRLYFDNTLKRYKWSSISGVTGTGSVSNQLQNIYSSKSGFGGSNVSDMGRAAYHDWTHIKLNCWGAKNKAVRWLIQLVTPLDDEVCPWPYSGLELSPTAAQTWEARIKQFTFNPIASMNWHKRPALKVLKSHSFIINPTESTENDPDPQVKTLKWFVRRNRVLNFGDNTRTQDGQYQTSDVGELSSVADDSLVLHHDYVPYPRSKQQLYLIVQCTDYSSPAETFSNTLHGSYDIDFRSKFTTLD